MASVSVVIELTAASEKRLQPSTSNAFLKAMPVRPCKVVFMNSSRSKIKLQVKASFKRKAVAGITAAAYAASLLVPEVAEAAGGELSPSLKNFLLSIVAGGVVLAVILGAVIAVSNFDPVKRN